MRFSLVCLYLFICFFFWSSFLNTSLRNNKRGGLGLSNEMIRNRNPIYAYEAVWISTRADRKEKVEFEEETPKIFYKWKWFSVITMNIFIKIGTRIFIKITQQINLAGKKCTISFEKTLFACLVITSYYYVAYVYFH